MLNLQTLSKRVFNISILLGSSFVASLSFAVPITIDTTNSDIDPQGFVSTNLDIDALMPMAADNQWVYSFDKPNLVNFGAPMSVTASIGASEVVGGGCLRVYPISFGEDLTLYVGNRGDSLSIHGMYLKRWDDLNDVQLLFETRQRVDWQNFRNKHDIGNVNAAPIAESCEDTHTQGTRGQDTIKGRSERLGLVLLEFLDYANRFGEDDGSGGVVCSAKIYDLSALFNNGLNGTQSGSGTAEVGGEPMSLDWFANSITVTEPDSSSVNISLDYTARIQGRSHRMTMNIVLISGQGVASLTTTSVTGDGTHDLSFTAGTPATGNVSTNELRPSGSCSEDSASFSPLYLLSFCILLGLRRKFG